MWDFLRYMSKEQAFSLSWGSSEVAGAGVGVEVKAEVWASKTVLGICCKSSLEYLRILVAAAKTTEIESFGPEGLAGCLENSDSRGDGI